MSETTTVTLSGFLLARIAEDEAAIDGDWTDGYDLHILSEPMRNRMLAEVEAKREIVELHSSPDNPCDYWYSSESAPCPTLRFLGEIYADHPDFRAEWRPYRRPVTQESRPARA